MADRVLFISWGSTVAGREQRGLEVFNESIGLYGRLQQEGRIESFDVAILTPSSGIDGYIQVHGTAAQLADVREDEEFRRTLIDASLIVNDLSLVDGSTGEGVAHDMALYAEAIAKVAQLA
jgi:hypothetical protein